MFGTDGEEGVQGFTLCKREGVYTGDKYMRIDSDDQPFVFGLSFDKTFFSRDDCEGRLQQGILIMLFILSWYGIPTDEIVADILRRRPACLANIPERLIRAAVKNLKIMAWLMQHEVLTLHMAVGEACFKSYPKDISPKKKQLAGHSFGVLMFNPGAVPDNVEGAPIDIAFFKANFQKTTHIVEATGWMDEYSGKEEVDYSQIYCKIFSQTKLPPKQTPLLRSCTTTEMCESLYCYIYMLDEFMVFGFEEKQQRWMYGAHPSQIESGAVRMMMPEELIGAVLEIRKNPDQEIENPVLKQMKQYSDTPAWQAMLHKVEMAATCIGKNNKICSDILPFIHPPPDRQSLNCKRMEKWAPLVLADFQRPKNKTLVAFSTKSADVSWLKPPDGQVLVTHGFMRSYMHLVKKAV